VIEDAAAADTAAAAVLYDGDDAGAADLGLCLAERDGPLCPLIVADDDGGYPLYRLLVERVVSVNTAAAGGNAALLVSEG